MKKYIKAILATVCLLTVVCYAVFSGSVPAYASDNSEEVSNSQEQVEELLGLPDGTVKGVTQELNLNEEGQEQLLEELENLDEQPPAEESNEVKMIGDFELTSGYIVIYPQKLETSNQIWPVVTWANGTMCPPALYVGLLQDIAKAGYVVVASSDMMSGDGTKQIQQIDYLFGQSQFEGKLDEEKIIAMGHSQGGRSSVNAAMKDSRIKCVVSIAGSTTKDERKKMTDYTVPTLFLTGTADLIVPASTWIKPTYEKCNGPAVQVSYNGGIHTSCILSSGDYAKYITAWMDACVNGNQESMGMFVEGGQLSKDTQWKKFQCKNIVIGQVGSIFGEGSMTGIIILTGVVVVVVLAVAIIARKKNRLSDSK